MNIIMGGIIQESNTFSTTLGTIDHFKNTDFHIGVAINLPQTAQNELKGFQKAASEQGVTLIPTLYARAVSAGPITRDAFNELKEILISKLNEALLVPCDGVLFALHGAWVTEDYDDADGEIIKLIRDVVGDRIPIVITLDSHSNITRQMVERVNGIVGYRTFPHVDQMEIAYRAGHMLFSIVRGEIKPVIHMEKIPMILQAENSQTYRGPMFEMWNEAIKGEAAGASLITSLFCVQPWLDIDEMGFAIVVVGEDAEKAAFEAKRLATMAWDKREAFTTALHSVSNIVSMFEKREFAGPMILSDSADSPGAGSPGDSNFVLKKLLELETEKWLKAILSMVDGKAARQAAVAGVGQIVQLQVGHSLSNEMGTPLKIEGTVTHVGEGKFSFGGGFVIGLEANMGCTAVIAIGEISVLLMENPTFTGDPAMYRSVGLEPLEADFVLVKSANQFRAEYERLSEHIYILDTPGASTANLKSLPFHKISRPMYPLDDYHFYQTKGE